MSSGSSSSSTKPQTSYFGFEATRWSLVQKSTTAEGGKAFDELCRRYWKPLIKFATWQFSLPPADAEDAVQGFLAFALQENWFAGADRARGRFRTYLFLGLKSRLMNEWKMRQAKKRGGGVAQFSATLPEELANISGGSSSGTEIERAADREWAKATLTAALAAMEASYTKRGQGERFKKLWAAIFEDMSGRTDCRVLAASLSVTEGQAAVEVFRFRKRLKAAFLEVVRDTVSNAEDEAEEASYLLSLLSWE